MTGRHIVASIVGGILMFCVGFLIYGIALASFLQANAGHSTNALRDPPLVWAIAAGDFVYAAFLTLLVSRRPTGISVVEGLKLGGLAGFLTTLSSDFIQYATHDVANLTATMVNPLAFAVLAAMAGGAIAMVLRR